MQISNKFDIGDVVYYPAADMNQAQVLKAEVKTIIVVAGEKEGTYEIAYNTGGSYGIPQDNCFKQAAAAKRRLVKLIKDTKSEQVKHIDDVIKQVKATDVADIIRDLTLDYAAKMTTVKEETDAEETEG